ncbi:MAG: 3-dehydroquinate synthase [Capsulimonadaceae bacterium]|nr:3-dehydroquinate synthase [Capsulimonadaceae bacterium]
MTAANTTETNPSVELAGASLDVPETYPEIEVRVELETRSYDIIVRRHIIRNLGAEIVNNLGLPDGQGRTAAVLINPKVDHYYGQDIYNSLKDAGFTPLPIVLVAGECYKTLQTARRIYRTLYEKSVDRRTLIIAVGGGVIGDVAGFVAATYQRGLDFIQVPTTLLAQVDSSVGGKVGVNFEHGKNLIGAFYQPKLVLIDPSTLNSLPHRERRSGLAEIIKYGAIYDEGFYKNVDNDVIGLLRLTSTYLESAIARSCQIKAEVVAQDERENGLRAILNFGHSVGHALESLTGYHVYRHGEAIAVGMVSAALIGEELGITPPSVTSTLVDTLTKARFPIGLDERLYINDIVSLLSLDKKAIAGNVRFVLLNALGHATPGHEVPEEIVRAALQRQRGF